VTSISSARAMAGDSVLVPAASGVVDDAGDAMLVMPLSLPCRGDGGCSANAVTVRQFDFGSCHSASPPHRHRSGTLPRRARDPGLPAVVFVTILPAMFMISEEDAAAAGAVLLAG
jgi:hypothetical protein